MTLKDFSDASRAGISAATQSTDKEWDTKQHPLHYLVSKHLESK